MSLSKERCEELRKHPGHAQTFREELFTLNSKKSALEGLVKDLYRYDPVRGKELDETNDLREFTGGRIKEHPLDKLGKRFCEKLDRTWDVRKLLRSSSYAEECLRSFDVVENVELLDHGSSFSVKIKTAHATVLGHDMPRKALAYGAGILALGSEIIAYKIKKLTQERKEENKLKQLSKGDLSP